MSSIRTESAIVVLLLTATVTFTSRTSANGSLSADTMSIGEYFIAKNPKGEHPQFQNTNVHVIFACIFARDVEPTSICEDLNAIAAKKGPVTYLESRVEHEVGVNFLVSKTTYPTNLFKHVYGPCGFRNLRDRSIVIVKNQSLRENLEGCFYTSSLIHLGFYVDTTISAQIDKKSFDEIIAYYVSSNVAP